MKKLLEQIKEIYEKLKRYGDPAVLFIQSLVEVVGADHIARLAINEWIVSLDDDAPELVSCGCDDQCEWCAGAGFIPAHVAQVRDWHETARDDTPVVLVDFGSDDETVVTIVPDDKAKKS